MSLHPSLQSMLDKAAGLPPLHTVPVAVTRAGDIARFTTAAEPDPVHSAEDRLIPGPGGDLRIRIYRPDAREGLPVLVFFHGSGFVVCSIETHDGMCRQICHRGEVIVVSVDYRLAPENRFPAAIDDGLAATLWCVEHASEFGGDAARIGVGGDSAGGNIAAVTALQLRDRGTSPIRAQFLAYPVTDHYSAAPPSYEARATGYGLTRDTMTWFWDQYLPDAAQGGDPRVSPLRAEDLSGLPAAYVITAGYDLLCDEGLRYADRLAAAGVAVEHRHYADMNHGFLAWVGVIDRSTEAMDAACAWLRSAL